MKRKVLWTSVTLILALSSALLADRERGWDRDDATARPVEVETASEAGARYRNECGACHMAYQPEFLPKRSWQKMMRTLSDHFGLDATLEEDDRVMLSEYLAQNAADAKRVQRTFWKMVNSIEPNTTPLRISDIRYFRKEHREIPRRFVEQAEVKSMANCTACHPGASFGDYEEDRVRIPNYGRWDD